MKIVSLGLGAWLAERAGVEVVYFSGGLLFTFGLIGLMALHKE